MEHPVVFGTVTSDKSADILVFQKDGKTAKIIVEVKRPERKDGLNQLKSYLNAEGSPVGVWSNGLERVILYRPYPKQFEDTLTESTATEAYRREMDVMADFIEEHCVLGERETADAGLLYKLFQEWSEKNGEEILTQKSLGAQLRERGFEPSKKRGHRCWVGLRLRRENDDD